MTENENQELTIIQSSSDIDAIEASNRAEYDIQIATAKKYPRNLARIKDNVVAIATMSKETAETCRYALPRGGKTLSGASVHLARIMAQQYGNIRVDSRVKQITDKQVISEAVCFDLETNYAVKVEVRRSIVTKTGQRFNDDMITVTGNAASAIAYRNAVLAVIPKGITDTAYNASVRMITGDLTSEEKLIAARNKAVNYFKDTYGVTEEQVLKAIGLRSIGQIKAEQIADLRGLEQSLKDGDTTVDDAFGFTIDKSQPVEAKKVTATGVEVKSAKKEEPKAEEPLKTDETGNKLNLQ